MHLIAGNKILWIEGTYSMLIILRGSIKSQFGSHYLWTWNVFFIKVIPAGVFFCILLGKELLVRNI